MATFDHMPDPRAPYLRRMRRSHALLAFLILSAGGIVGSDQTQPAAAGSGVWNIPFQGPCPPHFPNCNDPPPPPPPAADTTPPRVLVKDVGLNNWTRDSASADVGAVVNVVEASRSVTVTVTLLQGTSVLDSRTYPGLTPNPPADSWDTLPSLKISTDAVPPFQFCAQATDSAGNTSAQSCSAEFTPLDVRVPQVKAGPVTADVPLVRKRGNVINLPWTASDDRGRVKFTVTVFNFGKALWSQTYPDSSAARTGETKSAPWPIPAGGFARGSSPEHWCVQATDPAGNSARSCAAITLTGDRYAPMVEALRSTAWAGQVASLRFKVNDPDNGSRKAKRTVTLHRDGRLIWQRQVDGGALLPARAGDIYAEEWSTPATLAGAHLQFCVLATDAAGNSAKDCATITLTRDTTPPKVHALPASGRRGQTINLRYTVRDNSGQTSDEYAVYAVSGFSQKLIARNATKLGPVGDPSSVRFYLPLTLRPGLIFCVVSRDAAGNTSVKSCAAITLT